MTGAIYVDWWAKDDATGQAAAGGFFRCDTTTEYVEFMQDAQERRLAVRVVPPVDNKEPDCD